MDTINLYDAIAKMREMTDKKEKFSFAFMSCDTHKQESSGVIEVRNALLTKQSKVSQNKNADIMLNYFDHDQNATRHFYQPLLMVFNGKKVILN